MGKLYQVRIAGGPTAPPSAFGPTVPTSPLRFRTPDGSFFITEEELGLARAVHPALELLRELDDHAFPVRFCLPHDGAVHDHAPEDARRAVLARLVAEGRADGGVHVRYLGRNRLVPPDGFVLDRAGGERRYVWQLVPAPELEREPELRERFRALHELFHDPDTKVVLALGSGGLKLFAHATALRFLEQLGCAERIGEIWGSSGGAIVGLLFSHGLSPQAIEQTGYDLYSGRYALPLRPSRLLVIRHLLRDALLPTTHRNAAGFVDLADGLARMLEHYCSTLRPRRPFFCTAFNLLDCRPEVLSASPVPGHLEGFAIQTDPREAALASAAVPLLFVPRRIRRNGREIPYVDGSTTEDVPLYSAVRKWDLDRAAGVETRRRLVIFYVKLTGGLATYRTQGGRIGKLRLLQTVAAAGIETMHRRDVALLTQRSDLRLLALELGESTPDFFELGRIPAFIRAAKEAFPLQLAEIEERLRRGSDS